MKKLLFILSIFISVVSFGQNTHIIPGNPLNAIIYADSLTGGITHIMGSGITFNQGDTLVLFSDSYGNASGATTTSQGFGQLYSYRVGAILNDQSANGSTLEKRTPTNPFTGVNAIDRLGNLPHFSTHTKYIIISLGLNDIGVNSANYNTTNYQTDYDSVLHYITSNLAFPPENILVVSPPWIGAVGQASYAVLSGNAAPTTARAITFIQAAQAEAVKWQTGYFAPYWYELHDTTHMSSDGIHPDDAGYAFIANYLNVSNGQKYIFPPPFTYSTAGGIKANIQNQNLILGDHTTGSTTTPMSVGLGKTFYSSTSAQAHLKLYLYEDGTSTNNCGFAVTPGHLEIHSFATGAIDGYIGGVEQFDQQPNVLQFYYNGTTTATSVTTPTAINLGASYNSTQGSNALKLYLYNNGSAFAGIGHASNSQYYSVYIGGHHDFYINGTEYMGLSATALTMTTVKTILAATSTTSASLNIPSGTAPTSPAAGDMYYDGTHLYFKPSGSAVDLLASGTTPTFQQVLTAGATFTTSNTVTIGTNDFILNGSGVFKQQNTAATTTYGSIVGPASGATHYGFGHLASGAFDAGYLDFDATMNMTTPANLTVQGNLSLFSTSSMTLPIGSQLKITEGAGGRAGQVALVSGTKAITISGVTTSSRAFVTLVSQSGTVTTTVAYEAVCTSNTLTLNAVTVAGTNALNTSDASTLNYFIIN
jgi:lysophospholipase L1-like esterase